MQPLLCNIDWLGVSLHLLDHVGTPPNGYIFVKYDGTNVWQNRRVLYTDDGRRVLTLLSMPKSKLIKGNAALVEVDNEWLYHGIGDQSIMDLLFKIVPYSITGLSRLDLCLDFEPSREQAEIIEQLATGDCYVQGKRNGSGFWSINRAATFTQVDIDGDSKVVTKTAPMYTKLNEMWLNRRIPHCVSWGHKTSDVKWKLYYKTKELLDAASGHGFDKPYIVDQWRCEGLDITNVWRLEVSLHNCNRFRFDNRHITFEQLREDAHGLFRSLYAQRFVVRRNQRHVDRSNDDVVDFLPVGKSSHVFRCDVREPLAKRNGRITLLRHLVGSLDDVEVLLDDDTRERVLWLVGQQIDNDGLDEYFMLMTGRQYADYVEDKRVEAYELRR